MMNRHQTVSGVFVLLFVGLGGFFNLARNPRFETFHTLDVIQLIATGMCFGAALQVLIMFFRGVRTEALLIGWKVNRWLLQPANVRSRAPAR